jgi:phosphatidylserine/phosphatidylglycerophosphate/cardiolipin synthase-like enzyme
VPATPYPEIGLGGGLVEVYFSPDDGVSKRLVELLNSADESIYFMAYSFTSDDLAQAVIARYKSGVTISGVFDSAQVGSNLGTEYPAFKKISMDVRLDGNLGQMHHKVMIIDEAIVVLGSYNFSANAERNNDENLLVLHNPKIAKAFIEEFKRVYAQALP